MPKTFWLSFVRDHVNVGCAIIEVSDEEAAIELAGLNIRFPNHIGGAEWTAAAITKAHVLGCNPGGEVASWDITDGPPDRIARYEKGRLYSRREIEAIEKEIEAIEKEIDKRASETVMKELREWDAKDPLH